MPAWLDDFLWTYQNLVHALGVNGLLALSMYVVLAAGQLSLGQAAFIRQPEPNLAHPGIGEIEQRQRDGTVRLGAQALPPVIQVVNGQLREIAGELAEISGAAAMMPIAIVARRRIGGCSFGVTRAA